MARYYTYRRKRYGRRFYRRAYGRYAGTSLRRYRSVQMNDNETKVMTFTGVSRVVLPVTGITATGAEVPAGSVAVRSWSQLLNQIGTFAAQSTQALTPSSGRAFFAGMMFDRLRVRSLSVVIRPLVLPSSSTTGNPTITLYAAWDRYAGEEGASGGSVPTSSSIMSDPSAKSVTWTAGGSGTSLRTWIYSTNKDRYQYIAIQHSLSLVSWVPQQAQLSNFFAPKLYFTAIGQNTVTDPTVQFQVLARVTLEFQGGYSSTTLNYVPTSGASLTSLEDEPAVRTEQTVQIPNAQPTQTSYAVSSYP